MDMTENMNNIWRVLRRKCLKVDPRGSRGDVGQKFVFRHLKSIGFPDGFEGKRICGIGPKHGKDSLLVAKLKPSDLVTMDLPEKRAMVEQWLP